MSAAMASTKTKPAAKPKAKPATAKRPKSNAKPNATKSKPAAKSKTAAKPAKKWSQHVTETSDAMDLAPATFTGTSAKKIAEALEHDAEKSKRRKSTPYRSAMSMLTFYINRAGKNLSAKQRKVLEDAKDVLRAEFGPDAK
jgi:hypothetical protein